ncbi:MAG TPA: NADPH-dependent F420 reductase [Polyangia bacterium]
MRIGIIGTGNMANALGNLFLRAGHDLFFGSRDPKKGTAQADTFGGGATGGTLQEAVAFGDTLLLAVPFPAAREILAAAGPIASKLTGKILIDITNPLTPDFMALTIGHTTSAAEEIAALVPRARVVKAFNHLLAGMLKGGLPQATGPNKISAFLCGDENLAKERVADLARSIGLDPIDVGPLKNARYLEPTAELLIQAAYGQGLGPEIALTLLRR